MSKTPQNATPLMKQYFEIKARYPDTILLFQVGDFYELFFDDAKTAASVLSIALTKRGHINGEPIPLCGVPLHALDNYLNKLVKAGYKVAIADQLSEPVPGKVVERGVRQVLTPGTLTDSKLLDEKSASYLFSFFPMADQWGLLFGELLTAQLFATVMPAQSYKQLEAELTRFFPDEILLPEGQGDQSFKRYFKNLGYASSTNSIDDDQIGAARAWLSRQFNPQAVKPVLAYQALQSAVAHFYAYIKRNQESAIDQFTSLHVYQSEDYLILDAATQRNLELIKNNQDGTRKNTLLSVIDGARTSMGSRMIKKWLMRPLVAKKSIMARQDSIAALMADVSRSQQLADIFVSMGDIERIVGRVALGRALLNDYLSLARALEQAPAIKSLLSAYAQIPLLTHLCTKISDFAHLHNMLTRAINDDSAQDWLIKTGFDQELDRMRDVSYHAHEKIIELERQEQIKTGINSLKIRYNNVHGYYIEVSKLQSARIPDEYRPLQSLVGRERFATVELKNLETEIVRARNEVGILEKRVFEQVKQEVYAQISPLRHLAYACAQLDALLGLARIAYDNGYTRPELHEDGQVLIVDGRHPVVEQHIQEAFIPNSVNLCDQESLWIITGPNMGGKSTYLRQIAQTCVLAHMGSFVPAKHAHISLLDRIFTRIGASDNVADGKSTFLVEMEETALICQQATKDSLVILDEVGRGTSTFDGVAIAQAVIEYIYSQLGARCLFATHYHELTKLSDEHVGIACYHASSKQTDGGILFLHKIIPGVATGSFGLEVAQLADLPVAVVDRARDILKTLSLEGHQLAIPARPFIDNAQLSRLQQENQELKARLSQLRNIDLEDISPRKALDILWELKK